MLEALISGKWIADLVANAANAANEEGFSGPSLEELTAVTAPCPNGAVTTGPPGGDRPTHETTASTLFNDPERNMIFEIPAETPCWLVTSIADAQLKGWITSNAEALWARERQSKGGTLFWVEGQVRCLLPSRVQRLRRE